jgi:hypothetical protein
MLRFLCAPLPSCLFIPTSNLATLAISPERRVFFFSIYSIPHVRASIKTIPGYSCISIQRETFIINKTGAFTSNVRYREEGGKIRERLGRRLWRTVFFFFFAIDASPICARKAGIFANGDIVVFLPLISNIIQDASTGVPRSSREAFRSFIDTICSRKRSIQTIRSERGNQLALLQIRFVATQQPSSTTISNVHHPHCSSFCSYALQTHEL